VDLSRDILSTPLRAQLFDALTNLCRPASTQELAERVGRHHNSVRVQLGRLAAAGLIEQRVVVQGRGRPHHVWAIPPEVAPGGRPPEDHRRLSGWLARAMASDGSPEAIETIGREIGRELGEGANGRPLEDSLLDALAALGFVPRREMNGTLRFVLRNCPYRDAVLENQPAVCGLHRGITRGLLDQLDAASELAGFVAKDPRSAGCLVEVTR
jgi:predicted ArsR family transcriptional regulator